MSDFTIERPNIEDALRISILLKTVYIDTYGTEGVTFEFTNFITKRFSPENIARIIKENPDQLILACYNGNPVGAAEVIRNSTCPIRKTEIAELSKLYILEAFTGKGVGYLLMQEAESVLKKEGHSELCLEVLASNQRAVSFYEKQGFKTIGHVDFPMEVNTYDNLVMTKVLP